MRKMLIFLLPILSLASPALADETCTYHVVFTCDWTGSSFQGGPQHHQREYQSQDDFCLAQDDFQAGTSDLIIFESTVRTEGWAECCSSDGNEWCTIISDDTCPADESCEADL